MMKLNIQNKTYGLCPVCMRGHIIQEEKSFVCNNRLSEKPCYFRIFKSYHSTMLQEEDVRDLVEKGETHELQFINFMGNPFRARLQVVNGKVETVFDNKYLKGVCPVCGGRIQITENGYSCENRFSKKGRLCHFYINKMFNNRLISEEEAEQFLAGERHILDHFFTNSGVEFSAIISVNPEGYVRTCTEISVCPQCGGNILIGTKAFNCSNFKSSNCKFHIPRTFSGYHLTIEDVKDLCECGVTDPVELKLLGNKTVRTRLTFGKNYEIITIPNIPTSEIDDIPNAPTPLSEPEKT